MFFVNAEFHRILFPCIALPLVCSSLPQLFVVDKVFCSNVQDKMEAMSVV